MIYLIEDRLERQKQFLGNYQLPEDKINVISDMPFDGTSDEINNLISANLPGAEVILFHRGHVSLVGDNNRIKNLQEYCKMKGASILFFSGSIQSANYVRYSKSYIANVNSRIFYNNLRSFLEGDLDIRTLCFGRKYLLNEFMLFTNILSSHIHQISNAEQLDDKNRKYLISITKTYAANVEELTGIYNEIDELFIKENITIEKIKKDIRKFIVQVNNL